MSKLLVPLLKIFLRKISRNSIELHTDDLSEILVLQNFSENLSENLAQKDFWKVNRIEPLTSQPLRTQDLIKIIPKVRQHFVVGGASGIAEAAPGRRGRVRHRRQPPRPQNMRQMVPPRLRTQLPRGVQPAQSSRRR